MPFPTLSSSFPGGGKPSADFGGPVLFGKIKDQGVPTGAQVFPSGTLLIQSTGNTTNQVISTGAVNRASLTYIAVSTASLIGGGPPPYTGYGAGMALVASTDPHIEVWSSAANDWIKFFASTAPGNVSGSGSTGEIAVWTSSGVSGFTDFTWDNTNSVLAQGPGNLTTAANQTFVIGTFNTASSGNLAFIFGDSNKAAPLSADIFIIGQNNDLSSSPGVGGAFGLSNAITGADSWAFGQQSTISGSDSQSFGEVNTISGNSATAVGRNNTLSAADTYAFGEQIVMSHSDALGVGEKVASTASSTLSLGMTSSAEIVILSSIIRLKAPNIFAYNLPTTAPTVGSKQIWSNAGVLTVA